MVRYPHLVRPRDAVAWYELCLSNADPVSLRTSPSQTCELLRDPRTDLRGGQTETQRSHVQSPLFDRVGRADWPRRTHEEKHGKHFCGHELDQTGCDGDSERGLL